jgi:anthranilate phosphoribosyltransferase
LQLEPQREAGGRGRALASGRDLTAEESAVAVSEVLSGLAVDAAVAALLTALRFKGETAAELAGAVEAVRARVANDGLVPAPPGAMDTCGTGGDGANTVNVSTAAALVVAACGVPVAKHGNRSASGNSGSAEVLAELGVAVDAGPRVVSRCLSELGITFLLAPRFHPGLRYAAPVRRRLPFRTIFNLVGPLANPLRPDYQLVGVAGRVQAALVAEALARLGTRRAAVVTGSDGLDEVSLAGPTQVLWVEGGAVRAFQWDPGDFGLGVVATEELRVSGPADSAARISHVFSGEPGPIRDTVLANVAAALRVAGRCDDLSEGVRLAAEAIDSGRAFRLLGRWRESSHAPVSDDSGQESSS